MAVNRRITVGTALDLGQLFPTLFTATRKDLSSSGSPCPGKKAVLVPTFSFGRLVCSFHEAWIIMNFVCNIQRFILVCEEILASLFFYPVVSKVFLFAVGQKVFLL